MVLHGVNVVTIIVGASLNPNTDTQDVLYLSGCRALIVQ